MEPIFWPRYQVSVACAASSITVSACRRAISPIASMSQGQPHMCTGRMAFVRGVMAASIRATSMFWVCSTTSTNTGFAPTCAMTLVVAVNVSGVVITSSPGPTPAPISARCRAAVAEFIERACAARV